MPSVGPELPPHLAKRKRSIDDDAEDSDSPPHKVQAATAPEKRTLGPSLPPAKNPDELDVDDSSEDDYGPSIPATRAAEPAIPPSSKNPDELNIDEDDSEDDYGPSMPQPTTTPASAPAPPKRVLGPALPPALLSEMPSHPSGADPDSSSSDDDDYGPSLPPAPGSAAEQAYLSQRASEARLQGSSSITSTSSEQAKPQRDEWMLAPPTDSDWTSRVDPTKLKARKFATGKGAKGPSDKSNSGVSAIWTETPEEKRKRLEDQVLGRAGPEAPSATENKKATGPSKEDEEISRKIRAMRGQSMMEARKVAGTGKEEEDDPSKRAFDREKDMALGGQMNHGQKREMLAKAADFGSRFQKGSFL